MRNARFSDFNGHKAGLPNLAEEYGCAAWPGQLGDISGALRGAWQDHHFRCCV